jgi:glycosyltransferase involved in cell wall biosynthesis
MEDYNYSIVMFAYNEEKHIEKSVASIFSNVDKRLQSLIVIANGCNDLTIPILEKMQQQAAFSKLNVVNLTIGDKCNAWNEYVHNLHSDANVHFFTDADVEFTEMAFPQMFDTLQADKDAQAIAGIPFSGRNKKYYKKMVTEYKCLFGNCYGVKKEFIMLAQKNKFYLPIGLGWIDSAITKALKRDIIDRDDPIQERVTFNPSCGYKFKSLNPFNTSHIELYFSRIARYCTGKLQEKYLEKLKFSEWPRDLTKINKDILNKIINNEIAIKFYLKKRVINRLKKPLATIYHSTADTKKSNHE